MFGAISRIAASKNLQTSPLSFVFRNVLSSRVGSVGSSSSSKRTMVTLTDLTHKEDTTQYVREKVGDNQLTYVEARLKKFRPFTNGNRNTVLICKKNLWRGRAIKDLTLAKKQKAGRNNKGNITRRHRGGGHKRRYRLIDFKRDKFDMQAIIQRFEYDPNRTAFIALLAYEDSTLSYILAAQGMKVGDKVVSSRDKEVPISPGNAMPLKNMPIGTTFHNLEIFPGKGAQFARSAGTSCTLMDKGGAKEGYALVAIASKEQRVVPLDCIATVGVTSNPMHNLQNFGKAGRTRNKGRRPHVRGVAMNPVDHPMGGGEGKSSGGRPSCGPTGVLCKGFKTRNRGKINPLIVVPRGGSRKNKK